MNVNSKNHPVLDKCGTCYTNTPISVFKSDERCDTKRIKRCDPLYGIIPAAFIQAMDANESYEELYRNIIKAYWDYVRGKLGKLSDCQKRAMSLIMGSAMSAIATDVSTVEDILEIVAYYVGAIIFDFGNNENSDDCNNVLSAVGHAVAGFIMGYSSAPDQSKKLLTVLRVGIARAVAASPCCCSKKFVMVVLDDLSKYSQEIQSGVIYRDLIGNITLGVKIKDFMPRHKHDSDSAARGKGTTDSKLHPSSQDHSKNKMGAASLAFPFTVKLAEDQNVPIVAGPAPVSPVF